MDFLSPSIGDLASSAAPFVVSGVSYASDSELLEAQRMLAQLRRKVDAASAVVAGEIAHRSRRELGYSGLAQRLGARTAEQLVQRVSGSTASESRAMVRVGAMIALGDTAASVSAPPPWFEQVAAAASAGAISLAAAEAIRAGLGDDGAIPADSLRAAAATLVRSASTLTVERLAAHAREARAALDADGVLAREEELRSRRYLHLTAVGDGMTRLSGLLDPESAAVVGAAFDAATSPRRGGPRFVDPAAASRADDLTRDPRSTEQIALDAFVTLMQLASAVPGAEPVLGSRRAAVQVIVAERDLRTGAGSARIEGSSAPVSIATASRHVCSAGMVPVLFDSDGQVVNVGRDQRLFTARQRVGLAVRDGGCRFPGCDRPPSWCEAHHIDEWMRDGGRTDVADGVLLCRHHHLLVHNNGWRVERELARYYVVPPASEDPLRRRIPAPPRAPLVERALA